MARWSLDDKLDKSRMSSGLGRTERLNKKRATVASSLQFKGLIGGRSASSYEHNSILRCAKEIRGSLDVMGGLNSSHRGHQCPKNLHEFTARNSTLGHARFRNISPIGRTRPTVIVVTGLETSNFHATIQQPTNVGERPTPAQGRSTSTQGTPTSTQGMPTSTQGMPTSARETPTLPANTSGNMHSVIQCISVIF